VSLRKVYILLLLEELFNGCQRIQNVSKTGEIHSRDLAGVVGHTCYPRYSGGIGRRIMVRDQSQQQIKI
jgi:hypothetical protein